MRAEAGFCQQEEESPPRRTHGVPHPAQAHPEPLEERKVCPRAKPSARASASLRVSDPPPPPRLPPAPASSSSCSLPASPSSPPSARWRLQVRAGPRRGTHSLAPPPRAAAAPCRTRSRAGRGTRRRARGMKLGARGPRSPGVVEPGAARAMELGGPGGPPPLLPGLLLLLGAALLPGKFRGAELDRSRGSGVRDPEARRGKAGGCGAKPRVRAAGRAATEIPPSSRGARCPSAQAEPGQEGVTLR